MRALRGLIRRARGRALLALALCGLSTAAAAGVWQDLWARPDQQGAQLLRQGQPAAAAQHFHDPRWHAYAQLAAGRYDAAARELEALPDVESQYNRGNALARAGHLRAALKVYDAVLQRAPGHHDARANRELVAGALQHRDPASEGEEEQDATPDQQGRSEEGSGNATEDRARRSGEKRVQPDQSEASRSGDTDPGSSEQQGARQDAALAASLQRDMHGPRSPGSATPHDAARAAPPSDAPAVDAADGGTSSLRPKSEQALALEQWLRRIPEDPEGLLRRKFLIEHLLREQQEPQP